jgi:hypothetical protein
MAGTLDLPEAGRNPLASVRSCTYGDPVGPTRAEVLAALRAVDTGTLRLVAAETGYSLRSLRYYRADTEIPERRLRALGKALGLR